MKTTATAIALLAMMAPAKARCLAGEAPWVVYGQTQINANASVNNPTPNVNGLLGESSLPYVVPAGKVLVITRYAVEGYDATGVAVIFPYIGPAVAANYGPRALASAAADSGTKQISGPYEIPAGLSVNVRIINGSSYGGVYGWSVHGCVRDAP